MLHISHLRKRYAHAKRNAVDDLNLAIESGQIFGFLGPNGAGKSTTIKMLVGLLKSDEGTITFEGEEVQSLAYKRLIGYVADEPYFYEKISGAEHLHFIADLYGIDQKNREERIDSLSRTLLLKEKLGDEISSYSHGMKQKLAIIAALLPQPKLLVLDEPMVGLDPKAAYLLKSLLGDYAKAGNTVFFSTHVLEVAQSLCDTLGIIKEGTLLACGSFSELRGNGKAKDATLEQLFLELTEEGSAQ